MFNSTPDLDRLTTWAVGRFTSAHLTAPQLTEVAWYDPRVDFCQGTGGLAAGTAVSLCFNPWVGCKDTDCTSGNPLAMETTLHELAHVWMADLTKGTQQRFTHRPVWSDGPTRPITGASAAWNSPPRRSPGRSSTSTAPCEETSPPGPATSWRPCSPL